MVGLDVIAHTGQYREAGGFAVDAKRVHGELPLGGLPPSHIGVQLAVREVGSAASYRWVCCWRVGAPAGAMWGCGRALGYLWQNR